MATNKNTLDLSKGLPGGLTPVGRPNPTTTTKSILSNAFNINNISKNAASTSPVAGNIGTSPLNLNYQSDGNTLYAPTDLTQMKGLSAPIQNTPTAPTQPVASPQQTNSVASIPAPSQAPNTSPVNNGLSDYEKALQTYTDSIARSPEEIAAQNEYTTAKGEFDKRAGAIEGQGRGIWTGAVTGQQGAINRMKATSLIPLSERLTNIMRTDQMRREQLKAVADSKLNLAKTERDFAKPETFSQTSDLYQYDPTTKQYGMIRAGRAPATGGASKTEIKQGNIKADIDDVVSQVRTLMQQNGWKGADPTMYQKWKEYIYDTHGAAGLKELENAFDAYGITIG